MKMKNIIKKQQKTIFIGFMSVALFIICICTVCTAYAADKDNAKTPVDIPGLTYDHSMELSYAEEFSVDYYNDGYALITIDQEGQFLVVPEGKKAPKGLEKDITVIQQPLNNIQFAIGDFYHEIQNMVDEKMKSITLQDIIDRYYFKIRKVKNL